VSIPTMKKMIKVTINNLFFILSLLGQMATFLQNKE